MYDIESGFTRSQALKRKNDALSEDNRNLKFIVQGLRTASETEAGEILRRIRSSRDLDEAVAFINQASLLLPDGTGHSSPETQHSDHIAPLPSRPRKRLNSTSIDPRAPTLQMILNPPIMDGPTPVRDMIDGSSDSPTVAPTSASAWSSGGPKSHSRSPPELTPTSQDEITTQKKPVSLVRWISWNAGQKAQAVASDAAGTADRLNAL